MRRFYRLVEPAVALVCTRGFEDLSAAKGASNVGDDRRRRAALFSMVTVDVNRSIEIAHRLDEIRSGAIDTDDGYDTQRLQFAERFEPARVVRQKSLWDVAELHWEDALTIASAIESVLNSLGPE